MALGAGNDLLAGLGEGLEVLAHDVGDAAAHLTELLAGLGAPDDLVAGGGDAGGLVPAIGVSALCGGNAVAVDGGGELLVVGDRLALVAQVDHAAALGVAHVDVIVHAVDLVGAKAGAGDGAVLLHGVVLGDPLQPRLDLLAGDLDLVEQVVVITIDGVAVLQGNLGGLLIAQQLAHAEVSGGHGGGDGQIGLSGPDLHLVDQIHGVALDVEQVGLVVPLAAQGAHHLVNSGQAVVVVGLHELLQLRVVLLLGKADGLALADGKGAVAGEGDGCLGQVLGAAVDNGDRLAVGVLKGVDAGGVVVAGDDHVDAGGVLNEVVGLILGVEVGLADLDSALVAGAHKAGALAGVDGHDHDVAGLLLAHHLLPVVGPLIGEGALVVALVDKVVALVVGGGVPVGDVHVLKAQHADLEGLLAHGELPDDVGSLVYLLGFGVDVVGAQDGDGLAHLAVRVLHGVVDVLLGLHGEVELVVAHDKGVIPAVAQAQGDGVVHAVLAVDIVAGDGGALDGVAVVNEDNAVHRLPLGGHGGGHLQVAVLNVLAVGGVEAVALAVHVGGGVHADGDGLRLLGEGGDAHAAQRHEDAEEQGGQPLRAAVMFHTLFPFLKSVVILCTDSGEYADPNIASVRKNYKMLQTFPP